MELVNSIVFPRPAKSTYGLSVSSRDAKLVHIPRMPSTPDAADVVAPGYIVGYYISPTFKRLEEQQFLAVAEEHSMRHHFSTGGGTGDGVEAFTSDSPRSPSHLVIYCHPNAVDAKMMVPELIQMAHHAMVDILSVEFTGYGMCGAQHCDISRAQYFENKKKAVTKATASALDATCSSASRAPIGVNLPDIDQSDRTEEQQEAESVCGVLPSEYPDPAERHTYRDLEVVLTFAEQQLRIPTQQIILAGRSIGTGPTVQAAAFLPTALNLRSDVPVTMKETVVHALSRVTSATSLATQEYDSSSRFVPCAKMERYPLAGVFLQAPFTSIAECIKAMIESQTQQQAQRSGGFLGWACESSGFLVQKIAMSVVADRFRSIDSIPGVFSVRGRAEMPDKVRTYAEKCDAGNIDSVEEQRAAEDACLSPLQRVLLKDFMHPPYLVFHHGTKDGIVPMSSTTRLIEAAKTAGKYVDKFISFEESVGFGHNNLSCQHGIEKLIKGILVPRRAELRRAWKAQQEETKLEESDQGSSNVFLPPFRIADLSLVVEHLLPRYLVGPSSYYHELYTCSRQLAPSPKFSAPEDAITTMTAKTTCGATANVMETEKGPSLDVDGIRRMVEEAVISPFLTELEDSSPEDDAHHEIAPSRFYANISNPMSRPQIQLCFGSWAENVLPHQTRPFGTVLRDLCGLLSPHPLLASSDYCSLFELPSGATTSPLPRLVSSLLLQKELSVIFTSSVIAFIHSVAVRWLQYRRALAEEEKQMRDNLTLHQQQQESLPQQRLRNEGRERRFIREHLLRYGNPLGVYMLPTGRYLATATATTPNSNNTKSRVPSAGFHAVVFGSLILDPASVPTSNSTEAAARGPMLHDSTLYQCQYTATIPEPEGIDSQSSQSSGRRPYRFPRLPLLEFELPHSIWHLTENLLKTLSGEGVLKQAAKLSSEDPFDYTPPIGARSLHIEKTGMFLSEAHVDCVQLACERLVLSLVQREEEQWRTDCVSSPSRRTKSHHSEQKHEENAQPSNVPELEATVTVAGEPSPMHTTASNTKVEKSEASFTGTGQQQESDEFTCPLRGRSPISSLLIPFLEMLSIEPPTAAAATGESTDDDTEKPAEGSAYLLTPLYGYSRFTALTQLQYDTKALAYFSSGFSRDYNVTNDLLEIIKKVQSHLMIVCRRQHLRNFRQVLYQGNTASVWIPRMKNAVTVTNQTIRQGTENICDALQPLSALTGGCTIPACGGDGDDLPSEGNFSSRMVVAGGVSNAFADGERSLDELLLLLGSAVLRNVPEDYTGHYKSADLAMDLWDDLYSEYVKCEADRWNTDPFGVNSANAPPRYIVSLDGPSDAVRSGLVRPPVLLQQDELKWIVPSEKTTAANEAQSDCCLM